jgi:hypothetical protein
VLPLTPSTADGGTVANLACELFLPATSVVATVAATAGAISSRDGVGHVAVVGGARAGVVAAVGGTCGGVVAAVSCLDAVGAVGVVATGAVVLRAEVVGNGVLVGGGDCGTPPAADAPGATLGSFLTCTSDTDDGRLWETSAAWSDDGLGTASSSLLCACAVCGKRNLSFYGRCCGS